MPGFAADGMAQGLHAVRERGGVVGIIMDTKTKAGNSRICMSS